jgi:hypothetical protein
MRVKNSYTCSETIENRIIFLFYKIIGYDYYTHIMISTFHD